MSSPAAEASVMCWVCDDITEKCASCEDDEWYERLRRAAKPFRAGFDESLTTQEGNSTHKEITTRPVPEAKEGAPSRAPPTKRPLSTGANSPHPRACVRAPEAPVRGPRALSLYTAMSKSLYRCGILFLRLLRKG